ncbi:MAG TPA: hypothetical protein VHO69_15410 [Phototrophicaceae bacterium]|nr:hypothetical protein [Phototrophicaceae bacterium]
MNTKKVKIRQQLKRNLLYIGVALVIFPVIIFIRFQLQCGDFDFALRYGLSAMVVVVIVGALLSVLDLILGSAFDYESAPRHWPSRPVWLLSVLIGVIIAVSAYVLLNVNPALGATERQNFPAAERLLRWALIGLLDGTLIGSLVAFVFAELKPPLGQLTLTDGLHLLLTFAALGLSVFLYTWIDQQAGGWKYLAIFPPLLTYWGLHHYFHRGEKPSENRRVDLTHNH